MKKQTAVSAAILFAIGAISVKAAEPKINFNDILDCVKENSSYEDIFKGETDCGILEQIIDFLKDCKPSEDTPSENTPLIPLPDYEEAPVFPGDVPDENPESTPEVKPEEKPEAKPEEKPETKPEEKPESDNGTQTNSYASEILSLVNAERTSRGLKALTLDSKISSAALVRAKEIVSVFSHTRPDGRTCFTALSDMGISYNGAGENIAYGQRSASEVMTAWMNSEGHRANILNNSFTKLGVGVYESGGTLYFVQFFTY